jgi:Na+-transporting NADH:ubiquinone oxidoreductase subunit A
MGLIKIKKGLNLPIIGEPEQVLSKSNLAQKVALLGDDYVGMRPTMAVKVGDKVKLGQLLFTDKKMAGVKYTSPGAGEIIEVNRGEKRKFLSVVIQLKGSDEITFTSYTEEQLENLKRDEVVHQLVESGMWTSLRSRPFSKVANPETTPNSIFITAMDSNPLAPAVDKIVEGNKHNFLNGLKIISKLTDSKIFLCKYPGTEIPVPEIKNIQVEEFEGLHPAGNVGTHIHFLDPVGRKKTVWHIDAQDVIAIGTLFTTGKINVERVISLAGPGVSNPRLIRTRIGASVEDITVGELKNGENRIVSGSILSGHTAAGPTAYLGRYHQQISVLAEGRKRVFFGWVSPGFKLYSFKKILLSSLTPKKKFNFDTALHGGKRAIVPIGSYEKVFPLDMLPTYLLRALAVNDVEEAENLGCLELSEEDLSLCTFVCPSKINHGENLRKTLTLIEKEG